MNTELSEYELSLVPVFVRAFQAYNNRRKAIGFDKLMVGLANHGYKVTGDRIRVIIDHIRRQEKIYYNGKLYALLVDNDNYWISNDREEIQACISSLEQRATEIYTMAKAIDVTLTHMNYKRIQREENERREQEILKNQGTLNL